MWFTKIIVIFPKFALIPEKNHKKKQDLSTQIAATNFLLSKQN